MESVERLFIPDMQKEQKTERNGDGETKKINKTQRSVAKEIAPGNFQITFEHKKGSFDVGQIVRDL
jgi:hypothetical protein